MAHVYVCEFEHIAQKEAISLRVGTVNDRMRACNHIDIPSIAIMTSSPSNEKELSRCPVNKRGRNRSSGSRLQRLVRSQGGSSLITFANSRCENSPIHQHCSVQA